MCVPSPTGPDVIQALRAEMLDFVAVTDSRAPLYARLAAGIADRDEVLEILAEAPANSRLPVTLFAAIHYLLLAEPSEQLAAWYPNLSAEAPAGDPVPVLQELCRRRRVELIDLVRTRVPQTNEIGRSAPLVIALAAIAEEVGPLAQLDVGASAGLNLISDRLSYDFGGHRIGEGAIELQCSLRGPARNDRLPVAVAPICSRLGLDLNPVDLADADQVRWLEACVWPDQLDRFDRLRASLAEVAGSQIRVRTGNALRDLGAAIAELGPGHPVVTTSWVLNYLGEDGQRAFLAEAEQLAAERDLSLVSFEGPNLTPGLEWPAEMAEEDLSVLRIFRWRDGERSDEIVAIGHPHGYWLRWAPVTR